ncbi:MAG: SDR family NAD(P)-dependent oxidoreductase [Pseudomonadota bacterium]
MADLTRLDLSGRAYVVTGPAKGMGRDISLAMAAAGADLIMAGRDTSAIETVAEEVRAVSRRAVVLSCDITDDTAVEAMVAAGVRDLGRIDGLVNIAGTTGPSGKMLWEHTVDDYRDVFDVNVLGSVLAMRHVMPRLIARGSGSVVNIGGTFGFKGVRQASLYGATKWALRGITKSAALEAGAAGVRVNMVSPGGVDGPRLTRQLGESAAREGIAPEEAYARFAKTSALNRMSTADDVAGAVLFLLSDLSRNITGQDLLVDGGTIV